MHLVAVSMALLFAGLLNQQAAAPSLDYEVLQVESAADLRGEAYGPRQMHRVSWIGDAPAIAAAIGWWHELDGRRVEKELRRHAARGVCRKREEPAPDPRTRRDGRRRLLSQRWQALGLAK